MIRTNFVHLGSSIHTIPTEDGSDGGPNRRNPLELSRNPNIGSMKLDSGSTMSTNIEGGMETNVERIENLDEVSVRRKI